MKSIFTRILILLAVAISSTASAQITTCQASFTTTVDPSGFGVQVTNTSTGNPSAVLWTFGDGTSSSQINPPIHYYNVNGYVQICLQIWNQLLGCTSTFCDSVLVGNPSGNPCSASYSFQHSGSNYYFYGYSSTPAAGVTFSWDFGDGSTGTGQFPTHTFNAPGTYNVCLSISTTTGCTDTYCHSITIAAPPACSAAFTHSQNGLFNGVSFMPQYISSSATYTWDFGDGTTGTGLQAVHTYQAAGTYNACLTVSDPSNNCSATYCDSVTIGTSVQCQAAFSFQIAPASNLIVGFNDLSTGGATTWSWDFGDGQTSTSSNPTHTYAQPGIYIVCLTIGNPQSGCNSTVCHTVSLNATQCNAFFGYQSNGSTYYFYNNNTGYSHTWSFGDGTNSFLANPSHAYGAPGAYQVCHTVYDSLQTCSDTYCDSIYINAAGNCTASFSYNVDVTGYVLTFTNTSSGALLGATVWSFGDGTSSYTANPTHTYTTPGVYTVCLSITAPGTSNIMCSYCQSILIGNPAACTPVFYSFADSNAIGNGNVNFGIYSPCGNTQFVWDFGDGTTGAGPTPIHQYADSGWYYVCVTAFSPSGNYTECDSVYALRFATGMNENMNSVGLVVYPNPLSGSGHAQFTLATNAHVKATLLDMQGRENAQLLDEMLSSGIHKIDVNVSGLQNGIYLLKLDINGIIVHQRISVVN